MCACVYLCVCLVALGDLLCDVVFAGLAGFVLFFSALVWTFLTCGRKSDLVSDLPPCCKVRVEEQSLWHRSTFFRGGRIVKHTFFEVAAC